MGKNLILDYVEESPHNTNRAILSQVVDQYVEEVVNSMGPVGASVNADWSQNDETAADYIKNRPFYEEEATYKTAFQQNIEETPYTVPVKLIGDASKYRIICNEETIETGITESWKEEGGDYGYYLISTPWVDIKTEYFAEEGGSTAFTTKGDFTVPYDITIQCLKSAIIKQLDEKFIPDTVARTTDVPSIDNTLTIEGAAADAKAVGEAIANIEIPIHSWDTLEDKPFYETEEEVILEEAEFEDGAIKELNIEPNQAYNIKSGSKFYENIYSEILDDGRINLHVSGQTKYDEITITQTNLNSSFYSIKFSDLIISGYVGIIKPKYVKTIEEQFIPNTIARTTTTVLEDITEAPTAEQYNAILQVLRDAGILASN